MWAVEGKKALSQTSEKNQLKPNSFGSGFGFGLRWVGKSLEEFVGVIDGGW